MNLGSGERRRLLEIARFSIAARLGANRQPEITGRDPQRKAGCFVTLHAGIDLRGCIGTFSEDRPLCHVVGEMAIAAATEDPRFQPVTRAELAELTVEISVLSPRRPIGDRALIEVGRHGLWVERGAFRGVLLPQVATEAGWDAKTFLEHTCTKAGLPGGAAYDPATKVCVFEAEVFGEDS